jgi:hypothetical protein
MTRCPRCQKPSVRIKGRRVLRHVPALDDDPRIERRVHLTLFVCPAPAGCGLRFLVPVVEIALPPEVTELRYLAPDVRVSRRDTNR